MTPEELIHLNKHRGKKTLLQLLLLKMKARHRFDHIPRCFNCGCCVVNGEEKKLSGIYGEFCLNCEQHMIAVTDVTAPEKKAATIAAYRQNQEKRARRFYTQGG